MNSKTHSLLFALYSLLFFLTPLIVTPFTDELFEFPKMIFVYGITILLSLVFGLKVLFEQKLVLKKIPLTIPLIGIILSTVIATVFSTHFITSFYGYYSRFNGSFLSILSYILISIIFIQEFETQETKEFLKILLISTFIISIYALLQKFGIDKNYWVQHSWERVFSTLGQPNWLASFLVMMLPINVVLLINELTTIRKSRHYFYPFFLFISCLFVSLALLFTRSTSGYLAIFVIILSLPIFYLACLSPQNKNAKWGLAGIFLAYLGIFIFLYPNYHSSFLTKETSKIRLITWKATLNLIQEKPLLGHGLETYPYAFLPYRPEEINYTSEWNFLFNKPHNEYLEIASESGLVGIAVYLFFITSLFVWTYRNWKKLGNKDLIVGLILGYLGLVITLLFGFQVVITNLLFFLFPMFVLSLSEIKFETKTISFLLNHVLQKIFLLVLILVSSVLLVTIGKWFVANIYYNHGSNTSLEKAVQLSPFENTYNRHYAFALANTSRTTEQTEKALLQIQKTHENNPHNYLGLQTLTKAYLELAETNILYLDYALRLSEEQVNLVPTDPEAWYTQGLILLTQDKKNEAKASFQKATELKHDYQEALKMFNSLAE